MSHTNCEITHLNSFTHELFENIVEFFFFWMGYHCLSSVCHFVSSFILLVPFQNYKAFLFYSQMK